MSVLPIELSFGDAGRVHLEGPVDSSTDLPRVVTGKGEVPSFISVMMFRYASLYV